MITLLVGLLAAALGALVSFVILARKHTKMAMFDEIERDARFSMKKALGHTSSRLSSIIQSLSPPFCVIFEQASDAESYGLDQVCGVGYGRALEFLIKDYAKRETPSASSDIEKASLSECVRKYITDDAIRNSTDLARALRNDETHYLRKYSQSEVKDLKRLIALTIALIENSEQRKELSAKPMKRKITWKNKDLHRYKKTLLHF